eukprot:TRINITY_DN8920_c0_g2_i1.p1 TRINITY_DN8920_c0_g2~~TRINITY_DN8920_c0_g2_i1.p1  ORF type:complete len:384 (-),score=85.60 TRINITY_DN8920_c0_g2_i1:137-1288(-)
MSSQTIDQDSYNFCLHLFQIGLYEVCLDRVSELLKKGTCGAVCPAKLFTGGSNSKVAEESTSPASSSSGQASGSNAAGSSKPNQSKPKTKTTESSQSVEKRNITLNPDYVKAIQLYEATQANILSKYADPLDGIALLHYREMKSNSGRGAIESAGLTHIQTIHDVHRVVVNREVVAKMLETTAFLLKDLKIYVEPYTLVLRARLNLLRFIWRWMSNLDAISMRTLEETLFPTLADEQILSSKMVEDATKHDWNVEKQEMKRRPLLLHPTQKDLEREDAYRLTLGYVIDQHVDAIKMMKETATIHPLYHLWTEFDLILFSRIHLSDVRVCLSQMEILQTNCERLSMLSSELPPDSIAGSVPGRVVLLNSIKDCIELWKTRQTDA